MPQDFLHFSKARRSPDPGDQGKSDNPTGAYIWNVSGEVGLWSQELQEGGCRAQDYRAGGEGELGSGPRCMTPRLMFPSLDISILVCK